jgi:hypothetical protein
MAYNVCREKGGKSFYVLFEGDGVRRRIKRSSSDWSQLGFSDCKNIEEAKELAKRLTLQDKARRIEARRQRIQQRLEDEGILACAWLPPLKVAEFESLLRIYKVTPKHWSAAKHAILKIGLDPRLWRKNAFRFYDYFRDRGWSLKYCNTLRRTLNAYAEFFTDDNCSPIPPPTGTERNRIVLAHEQMKGRAKPSGRLSFSLLEANRERWGEATYNWLYISRAFGLRPEELEVSLRTEKKWLYNPKKNALHIYMPKAERVEMNPLKRWKTIPIKTPEQTKALALIQSGVFKKPSRKSMKGLSDMLGRIVTYYGGRKDFYPVMAKLYGEAEASSWLGHRSVETARRYYDDIITNAPWMDEEAA